MKDDELDQALAHFGPDLFGESTKLQVEEVLSHGQTVEPDARRRFLAAAQRALRLHAVQGAAFEVLAFETRRDAGKDIDRLAVALSTDVQTIRSVENGNQALQSLSASKVAIWIHELDIETETGLGSVRASLQPRRRQTAYAVAAAEESPDPDVEAFLDDIRIELMGLRTDHEPS
jgi:hypothetical protein